MWNYDLGKLEVATSEELGLPLGCGIFLLRTPGSSQGLTFLLHFTEHRCVLTTLTGSHRGHQCHTPTLGGCGLRILDSEFTAWLDSHCRFGMWEGRWWYPLKQCWEEAAEDRERLQASGMDVVGTS